jgi:hypothetical protein
MTMTLISTYTVTGSPENVAFTDIPQNFTDLYLTISMRTARAAVFDDALIWFNTFGTGTYSGRILRGTGSATGSITNPFTNQLLVGFGNGANSTSNSFSNIEVYIPNYTSASAKSVSANAVQENNGSEAWQYIVAGNWTLTEAINRIGIAGGNSPLNVGSTMSLYGITKA